MWARQGGRPRAVVAQRYQWFYVCSFVEPESGASLSLLVDGMDSEVMSWVLKEFQAWVGEGTAWVGEGTAWVGEGTAWVVLDRAGWHVSRRVEVPEGVALDYLPPYSPELQPAERMWPLVNEAVANRYFETLEAMMAVVAERCQVLSADPATVRKHTLFHWWPRMKEST
nr:transposase [Calidithermus terrae]